MASEENSNWCLKIQLVKKEERPDFITESRPMDIWAIEAINRHCMSLDNPGIKITEEEKKLVRENFFFTLYYRDYRKVCFICRGNLTVDGEVYSIELMSGENEAEIPVIMLKMRDARGFYVFNAEFRKWRDHKYFLYRDGIIEWCCDPVFHRISKDKRTGKFSMETRRFPRPHPRAIAIDDDFVSPPTLVLMSEDHHVLRAGDLCLLKGAKTEYVNEVIHSSAEMDQKYCEQLLNFRGSGVVCDHHSRIWMWNSYSSKILVLSPIFEVIYSGEVPPNSLNHRLYRGENGNIYRASSGFGHEPKTFDELSLFRPKRNLD